MRFLRFFFSCATGCGVNNKGFVKSSRERGGGLVGEKRWVAKSETR